MCVLLFANRTGTKVILPIPLALATRTPALRPVEKLDDTTDKGMLSLPPKW